MRIVIQLLLRTRRRSEVYNSDIELYQEVLPGTAYYQIIEDEKKVIKIDKQFEHNTYIRDFFSDNKEKSIEEAIKC